MLDMAEIRLYGDVLQHQQHHAPPYTVPDCNLIVNCLIPLAHNRQAKDAAGFFLSQQVVLASVTVG